MAFAPSKVAIAADSPQVAQTGVRIARQGGNAVDIAVSCALTATVSEVLLCSIGGSAFFMIGMADRHPELIDGGDAMPSVPSDSATRANWRNVYLPYGDGIEVKAGHASIGIPGMLAAAECAWQRHGRLPWREIVDPALEFSQTEIPAGATMAKWLSIAGELLFSQQAASRECFFAEDGKPVREGQRFVLPHMHQTMSLIQQNGAAALYRGELGRALVKELQDNGGFISHQDLASYRAEIRKPFEIESRGFQLALNPPPAIGGATVAALYKLIAAGSRTSMSSAETALLHARAQRRLLQYRKQELAQLDFDDQAMARLLADSETIKSPNTTHISVVTDDGSMVSATMSNGYGSGITIPGTGIPCNNSLGEPEMNPQGYYRAPAGSRLISNMAPTLAWHRDGRRIAIGSPGASRITTATVQTGCRHVLEGMSLDDAVEAPRLHVEPIDDGLRLQHEPGIDTSLAQSEFDVRPFDAPDMYFGAVKLAAVDQVGKLRAVADTRREGATEVFSD